MSKLKKKTGSYDQVTMQVLNLWSSKHKILGLALPGFPMYKFNATK